MTTRTLILLALTLVAGSVVAFGQTPESSEDLRERMKREDYYRRIDRKIENDIKATRINEIAIEPARFPAHMLTIAGRTPIVFSTDRPAKILFVINEGDAAADSFEIIPLAIQQQGASSDSALLGRTESGEAEYGTALSLKDLARLSRRDQKLIVDYIIENISLASARLEIPIKGTSSQWISPGYQDYWSFSKATSHHRIPLIEEKDKMRYSGIRPGGSTTDRATPTLTTVASSPVEFGAEIPKDSVESQVDLSWRPLAEGTRYRVTVARDNGFSQPFFRCETTGTSVSVPGLERGAWYYLRLQKARAQGGDSTIAIVPVVTRTILPTPQKKAEDYRLGYTLDLSMSRITLAHELLYSERALGIPGFGLEVNFADPVLSLLPYKNPAITWGGRFLFNATGKKEDVLGEDFLELKLLVKSRFNSKKMYDDMGALKYLFTPLISSEEPTLNVATPGFAIEVATSRWWGLPYLNFMMSTGSSDYLDPVYRYGPEHQSYAYWSSSEWRGSMAFYFNLDSDTKFYLANATGKRLNIVRLDLGVGTYNVSRITYDTLDNVASKVGIIKTSRIQPYISAEFVHSSQVKTGFGVRTVYFDNRLTLSLWLSLFKIGYHELRVEGTNILGPFGRAPYEWEASGGTYIQFRYRLGF